MNRNPATTMTESSVGPWLVWGAASAVQIWICVPDLWTVNQAVAVMTVLAILCTPLANKWRREEWAAGARATAALLTLTIALGEGYVFYTELGSWTASRDRAVTRYEETASWRARVEKLDAAAGAQAQASSRTPDEVQAEIALALARPVSARRDAKTLGEMTADCAARLGDFPACQRVLTLRVELATANKAADAQKALAGRAAQSSPVEASAAAGLPQPPVDPLALARKASGLLGGSVEVWAMAGMLTGMAFLSLLRELAGGKTARVSRPASRVHPSIQPTTAERAEVEDASAALLSARLCETAQTMSATASADAETPVADAVCRQDETLSQTGETAQGVSHETLSQTVKALNIKGETAKRRASATASPDRARLAEDARRITSASETRLSLRELAARLGVSKDTVRRALEKHPEVAEDGAGADAHPRAMPRLVHSAAQP